MRAGISLGMTVIDTAEIYGSEEFIGRAIAGQRDKRLPGLQGLAERMWRATASHAHARRASSVSAPTISISTCCTGRKKAVGMSHVVSAFEDLQAKGKIRSWGVSNFGDPRNGRSLSPATRRSLRNQSGPLQSRRPRHRAWRPAMVQAPRHAGHGLFAARRRRRQTAARSNARANWRRTRLHSQPPLRWPGPFAAAVSLRSPSPARRRM